MLQVVGFVAVYTLHVVVLVVHAVAIPSDVFIAGHLESPTSVPLTISSAD